ncbi:MAG: AAA family ATPase, partial [Pygmaiobacter sp.]
RYLASGPLPGIGPVTARRIVEQFGEDALLIIENNPSELARVKGMTMTKAIAASNEFRRVFGVREAIASLAKLGIGAATAISLYRALGPSMLELIHENPYLLCASPAWLPFRTVDTIAAELNFEKECQSRVKAGVSYVLRHNTGNGHCCLPTKKLLATVAKFIDVEQITIEEAIDIAVSEGDLVAFETGGVEYLYLPEYFRGEMLISGHLKTLLHLPLQKMSNPDKAIALLELTQGLRYAPLQRKAIETALTSNCMVLTGGPGTGKTTTIKAIIALFEQQADRVALAAPTGRAAKRMGELCGKEAKTIHRLLEVDYGSGETIRFIHNEHNPLKCDVVIIDEMSMVDLPLFESLLRALRPQCKIILVGDSDQLPSVGAGNVLRDIIDSAVIPVVCLRDIFRQAAESRIVRMAHGIVEGVLPDANEKNGDFFFIEAGALASSQLVCELVSARLPAAYGFDAVRDIQVLCPSKLGSCGTIALNAKLQELLNPPQPGKGQLVYMGTVYRVGDKVMQVRNNYDIVYSREGGEAGTGAFNGDMGIILKADARAQTLVVGIDDKTYVYQGEHLREIEIAYAVTIHKSQGSEFSAVVLPVASDTPARLCYRNLIYTGVTRAKQLLVLCGSKTTFASMVENDRRMLRYSCLANLLCDESIC